MEFLDEILERLQNEPKPKQVTIFDVIEDKHKKDYDKMKRAQVRAQAKAQVKEEEEKNE